MGQVSRWQGVLCLPRTDAAALAHVVNASFSTRPIMPYYPRLKRSHLPPPAKKLAYENLLKLKDQLAAEIPQKDLDEHLLLATWNIRDLGKNGPKHGRRTLEDLFYLAEIIAHFDLVAVQEVNDLKDWETIMDILGRDWDYIATDVSEWKDGGNGERMTFVYDKRKVWFKNIAGEVVLSASQLITEEITDPDNPQEKAGKQFARTPFIVSFQCGWFKFDLCTVHIYFGEERGAKLRRRIAEIEGIAAELKDRAKISLREKDALILLGDFNIVHPRHETMRALLDHGFQIPQPLVRPTNLGHDRYYDQIAIQATDPDLLPFTEQLNWDQRPNAGVFDLFGTVMKDEDHAHYVDYMKLTSKGKKITDTQGFSQYFQEWKTYHLSDHQPLWVRIPIDQSRAYLEALT